MAVPTEVEARSLPTPLAAKYIGRTTNALRIMRQRGKGPRGYRPEGSQAVHYLVEDLDSYLREQAAAHPADPADHPIHRAVEIKRPRRSAPSRAVA